MTWQSLLNVVVVVWGFTFNQLKIRKKTILLYKERNTMCLCVWDDRDNGVRYDE